jgi:hypothetical protein
MVFLLTKQNRRLHERSRYILCLVIYQIVSGASPIRDLHCCLLCLNYMTMMRSFTEDTYRHKSQWRCCREEIMQGYMEILTMAEDERTGTDDSMLASDDDQRRKLHLVVPLRQRSRGSRQGVWTICTHSRSSWPWSAGHQWAASSSTAPVDELVDDTRQTIERMSSFIPWFEARDWRSIGRMQGTLRKQIAYMA